MNLPEFGGRKMKVSAALGGRTTLGTLVAAMLMLGVSIGLSGC
jgi:hypothetical protein